MTRVVQNDGYEDKLWKVANMAMKITGLVVYNVAWTEAYMYLRTKWHLDPSSRLATTNMGRKLGAVPLSWGRGSCASFVGGNWVPM